MAKKAKLRGVGYIRMSSGKQEKSPAQQKKEIRALAKREGIEVVAWLDADMAITGDSGPEQRPDFGKMLDMAKQCEFDVLLAWDTYRIGRFDSLDAGRWLHVLRDAGIVIWTCCDGRIDPSETFDRLRMAFAAENANTENVKRAAGIMRGQIAVAQLGYRTGAPVPYAMDRAEFTAEGRFVRRLAKGEVKSRREHLVGLIPGEDAVKLDCVRYMFHRFSTASMSIRGLARELLAKGYPPPHAAYWHTVSVKKILQNPIYVAQVRWGKLSTGRYYTHADGIAVRRARKDASEVPNDPIIVSAHFDEPLVPQAEFDKVQQRLAKITASGTAARCRRGHPLSGMLYCECGARMYVNPAKTSRDGYQRRARFVCSAYWNMGRRCGHGYRSIMADAVQDAIAMCIRGGLTPAVIGELQQAIEEELQASVSGGSGQVTRLRNTLAEANREIGRLRQAIAKTDDDGLVGLLTGAKCRRDRVQREISLAGQGNSPVDIEAEAAQAVGELFRVGEVLRDNDPASMRGLWEQHVSRITLLWRESTGEKRSRRGEELRSMQVLWRGAMLYRAISLCANRRTAWVTEREMVTEFSASDLEWAG